MPKHFVNRFLYNLPVDQHIVGLHEDVQSLRLRIGGGTSLQQLCEFTILYLCIHL